MKHLLFYISISLSCLHLTLCGSDLNHPFSSSSFEVPPLDYHINLKNPHFTQGVLKTSEGGVITGLSLRIQAQTITYILTEQERKIEAETNLMVQYGDQIFVGDKLEYDLKSKKGVIYNGRTKANIWFLGGQLIELKEDFSWHVRKGFITSSAKKTSQIALRADFMTISSSHFLWASNIKFLYGHFPIFWLPYFKSSLKFITHTPIKYKIKWDKGLGPRTSMSYTLYTDKNLSLVTRLDYRLRRGLGAAFESKYLSDDGSTFFLSRSYGARDKIYAQESGFKRYRLQGLFSNISKDGKTKIHLSYDKLSDPDMILFFKSDDFEVNTQKKTMFTIHHRRDYSDIYLELSPRLNKFESKEQKLPALLIDFNPIQTSVLGIISENKINSSLLDYVYHKELREHLPAIRSFRFEGTSFNYRPLHFNIASVTPYVKSTAIFYQKSPIDKAITQGLIGYGVHITSHLRKRYGANTHHLYPYLSYEGASNTLESPRNVYIFGLEDALVKTSTMKMGLKQKISLSRAKLSISHDLYSDFLIKNPFYNDFVCYRIVSTLALNTPYSWFQSSFGWRPDRQRISFVNNHFKYTFNQHFAFNVELRYRSQYELRKVKNGDYSLEFVHSPIDLLDSPLSDRRFTCLSKIHVHLTPALSSLFQIKTGWGRQEEPRYTIAKIDIRKIIQNHWLFRLSIQYDKQRGVVPVVSFTLNK
ncbi:MAG: hypothetical protein ACOVOR_00440 [Rhabdochlamydiaceae bacterium]